MRNISFYGIKEGCGVQELDLKVTGKFNREGWDIYWTFNEFHGARKKENLRKIHAFSIDIDGGDKVTMSQNIYKNLTPSLVVETKSGFHIYWYLDEPIDCQAEPVLYADAYREFVKTRLLPCFDADPQACDATRLLRPPFFNYWKDGRGEFITDIALDNEKTRYSLTTLKKYFPVREQPNSNYVPTTHQQSSYSSSAFEDKFWISANALDITASLQTLSGSPHVWGEVYSFKKENNRTRIICNGRPCNAWIDANGRIGSTDGAGPAIPNWLFYYQRDWRKVAEIMRSVFNL